jgi:hypothetical protein
LGLAVIDKHCPFSSSFLYGAYSHPLSGRDVAPSKALNSSYNSLFNLNVGSHIKAMVDCTLIIVTSLLYLSYLVDGRTFTYSPNPTVGQTLTVTWFSNVGDPTSFSLALVNDDTDTGSPQQIQNVEATNDPTTGTVNFIPTLPGYAHIPIWHPNIVFTMKTSSRRTRVIELKPGGYVVLTMYRPLILI